MIEQIKINSVNTRKAQNPKVDPKFTGALDLVLKPLQACEEIPMLNVTVLDLSTAILPRTYEEGKTNAYAGAEAFRRESSGLVVNCLIPSFAVLGIAYALEKLGKGPKLAKNWANSEDIRNITEYWKVAQGEGKDKVRNATRLMLKDMYGVDGTKTVNFADFDIEKSVGKIANATVNPTKYSSKQLKKAANLISEQTHVSENIKLKGAAGKYTTKLGHLITEAPGIFRELLKPENADLEKFVSKSNKFINRKSLMGLFGVIIPLAISMQPLNRWLTAKSSGKKGAPIYKDFEATEAKQLSEADKKSLLKQKFISIGAMVSTAILSMGLKFPGLNVLQFKGLFPTMDQARIISTATFASRMAASEDKNDLREATVRDIATFSSFYFLGDYVAKGFATMVQKLSKGKIELINDLNKLAPNANLWQHVKHWTKDTALKSTEEVVGKQAKTMRSASQLANLVFSMVALGLWIPKMYRGKTNKVREEELKASGIDQKIIDKYYPHFMMNKETSNARKEVFQAFFTAK